MKYSFIIPVYNRPDEVDELLTSLARQTCTDYEVLVVEDGSDVPCRHVVERYGDSMDVRYFTKPNSGPGQTRNFGATNARGEYLIVLDSDVVLPEGYLQAVDDELAASPCDAFGGPDRAHPSFTPVQKAINYSMTSFFTTGGIRGGRKKLDKFYPRSFNMGVRASLWQRLDGFSSMRFGEDIDFSYRIFESGATCRLFPEAWVWHKRRTDFRKFFKQVHNSGIARINLEKRHPGTMKLVHLLPAVFTTGTFLCLLFALLCLLLAVFGLVALWLMPKPGCANGPMLCIYAGIGGMLLFLLPLLLFSLVIFVDASIRNRSLWVGLLAVPASFIQLIGYGTGFLRAWWLRHVCGRDEDLQAFRRSFYK